jgi:glycosyltransferase involved in cell wall biosynthesis
MAEKKNVLMLLSNPFRPDPRVHKEAKTLVIAGYSVTIICWDREQKYPREEVVDGIIVKRLGPKSSFEDTKTFLKTLPGFWKLARREMADMRPDIIHAHDLDTLSPAIKEARKRKIPLIYDSHEIYHEMASERLGRAMVGIVRRYEIRKVKKPDAVICVNERFRDMLESWGARNVTVVMGCPPKPEAPSEQVNRLRYEVSPDGKPVVMYIGVLEPNRNLMELVDGFIGDKSQGARLLVGGYGTLEKQLGGKKGPRFQFIGPVKPANLPTYTLAADILVAVYNPAFGNNRDSVPNKLFEAMSAGKPIIVAKGTWTGQTVERTECGLTVAYGTDEVFRAIDMLLMDKTLYGRCSANGIKAFNEEYNWPNQEKRLLDLYTRLAVSKD